MIFSVNSRSSYTKAAWESHAAFLWVIATGITAGRSGLLAGFQADAPKGLILYVGGAVPAGRGGG